MAEDLLDVLIEITVETTGHIISEKGLHQIMNS